MSEINENNVKMTEDCYIVDDEIVIHECKQQPKGTLIKFNTKSKMFEVYELIDSSEGGYTFYDFVAVTKKCPYCFKEVE